MAIGKYLSLEEARKKGLLDRFCKEHPSEADRGKFQQLLDAMTTKPSADQGASVRAYRGNCSETRTPSDTSEDDA